MSGTDRKANLKKVYWPDITNTLEASTALSEAVKAFYVVAAIQGGIGFFLFGGASALIEPAIVVALAFWLERSKARWTAALLALWSLLVVYSTFENKLSGGKNGGSNVILSIIIVCIAITSIRATWYLKKNDQKSPPKKDNSAA